MSKKLNTKLFIEKAIKKHGNRYDYSKTNYISTHTKVIIICPDHGEFKQSPSKHLYGNNCPSCSNVKKLTTEDFVIKSKEVHGNRYDYSKSVYKNNKDKVIIVCPDHGEFKQSPSKHYVKKQGCPKCSKKIKLTKEEFIERSRNIHGNRYDYSKVEYINIYSKVCILCHIHGEFWQSPNHHITSKRGCPICNGGVISNTEEFIIKANKIHNNRYDYSKVDYINNFTKICIICPIHGEFWQRPMDHIKPNNCPICSNSENISIGENEVISYIKSIYKGKIITNSRKIISPLELDIYIPEHSLAIEFDGLYWHSEKYKDKDYHLNKTLLCKEKGIRLIHIFEDEWGYKQNIVKARIKHALNIYEYKVYARECEVYEIENNESKEFLSTYHIQGNCSSNIKLGLYLGEELVAVMTFGKCRFTKKYEWELLRYCCISDHNVIGGAGKLLKAFERGWEPKNIISYCDLRWGTGGLYKALGFDYSHDSKSTYWYFKKNLSERESRIKYQKHKLHKLLEDFDPDLSEHENMLNHNYLRIYDCGNMVFIK